MSGRGGPGGNVNLRTTVLRRSGLVALDCLWWVSLAPGDLAGLVVARGIKRQLQSRLHGKPPSTVLGESVDSAVDSAVNRRLWLGGLAGLGKR